MRPGQSIGLGVLITIGGIVAGDLVYLLVPKKHFRIIAGILAANAIMAALALAGVEVAEMLVGWFALLASLLAWQLCKPSSTTDFSCAKTRATTFAADAGWASPVLIGASQRSRLAHAIQRRSPLAGFVTRFTA